MVNARLEMIFQNQEGRRVTISLQEPKADLTTQEVQEAMDLIVARNVFDSQGGGLVQAMGARLVTRGVAELF